MLISKKIIETQEFTKQIRLKGQKIGFVPTMGALHNGHVSLINRAKTENDIVICSIFVNPIQFNNASDLALYPRTFEKDCEVLEKAGCDFIFNPDVDEMYPDTALEEFNFGELENVMEGKFRPGHFKGVAIVVSRLFKITNPHNAYFGLKDFQQVSIVKALVKEKNIPVNIIACPTLREDDGLAMSSRNIRLSKREREEALLIYKALLNLKENKEKVSIEKAKELGFNFLNTQFLSCEYFEIVNPDNLRPIENWSEHPHPIVCVAAWCGKTRLIDNLLL
jgi:pantoate--beta-alanine ligase